MKRGSARGVLGQIQTLYSLGTLGGLTEAQLLELFLTRGEDVAEDAFAALVQRHGPMVLGVCRRMLPCAHDAEDAFQATFLILARRAASIGRRERLANWLYGVAIRTAREVRRRNARQIARERRLMNVSTPEVANPPDESQAELLSLLDEELNGLPARYRAALLACELEGKSRTEAAAQLGLPEGTLSTHLARGRKLVRDRLVKRGVSLGAGPFAGLAQPIALTSVPERLARSTVRAAIRYTLGGIAAAEVPATFASLAEGVLKVMLVTRLSVLMACVMAIGLTAVVTSAAVLAGMGKPQAGPTAAGRPAGQVPGRPLPEQFLVIDRGCALLWSDGAEKERLDSIGSAEGAFSPDGRWVAFNVSEPNAPQGKWTGKLVIQSRVRPKERTTVPLVWGTTGSSFLPIWSSDSQRILICEQGHNEDGSRGSAYRVYDLTRKGLIELKLPNEWWPSGWSADGKRVLTTLRTDDNAGRVAWVNLDGTGKPEFITSEQEIAYGARLSPDGRRILCMVGPKEHEGERNRSRLHVIDLITKQRTMIDRPGHTYGYCWSSDGLKVAYTWQMPLRQPNDTAERRTYLVTCDADGNNRKTVTSRKYEVPENSSGRSGVIIFFQVRAWWR